MTTDKQNAAHEAAGEQFAELLEAARTGIPKCGFCHSAFPANHRARLTILTFRRKDGTLLEAAVPSCDECMDMPMPPNLGQMVRVMMEAI